GVALGGIEVTQTLHAGHRVRRAHAGEAPNADRGSHQTARLRLLWEPLSEDGHVQTLGHQCHWASRSAGHDVNIGWLQARFTKAGKGPGAGAERQSRFGNMNGDHETSISAKQVVILSQDQWRLSARTLNV